MDNTRFGSFVAQRRKELNMTQKDLAQALHVSVQAVSKWERALNFPDIALLEPLADLLDVTVSELMAGERGAPPQEAAVRESLRVGSAQTRTKVRKWRRLFGAALALLLALVLSLGYLYIRDCTELLPQTETVVSQRRASELEELAAQTRGERLAFFDVTLADDIDAFSLQLEVWTDEGCVDVRPIGWISGFSELGIARRQVLACNWREAPGPDGPVLSYSISFLDAGLTGEVENIPDLSNGYIFSSLARETAVPESGTVLICFSLSADGKGIRAATTGNVEEPALEPGQVYLFLRLCCE